jgi:hypothetical protein
MLTRRDDGRRRREQKERTIACMELAFIGTGKEEKEEGVINQKVCKHIHK